MLDARFWILDPGCSILDAGCLILDISKLRITSYPSINPRSTRFNPSYPLIFSHYQFRFFYLPFFPFRPSTFVTRPSFLPSYLLIFSVSIPPASLLPSLPASLHPMLHALCPAPHPLCLMPHRRIDHFKHLLF
jgi:hypothetical protein